jgi:hypothetical protein
MVDEQIKSSPAFFRQTRIARHIRRFPLEQEVDSESEDQQQAKIAVGKDVNSKGNRKKHVTSIRVVVYCQPLHQLTNED